MPRWLDGRCVAASHSPLTNTTTTATTTGETKKFQTNKKKTIPFDGTIGKTHFRGPKWRWPNWVGGWGGAETKKKNNNKKPRKKNWGRNQNWIGTLICKILSFKKKKRDRGCRESWLPVLFIGIDSISSSFTVLFDFIFIGVSFRLDCFIGFFFRAHLRKKKETKSNHGNEIYGNISLHVNTLSSKRKQHIIVDVDVFILRNDWRKTAGRSFPWRIELKLDGVSVLVGFFDRLWSAGSLPWHFLLLLLSLDFFFCVVFFCFVLFFLPNENSVNLWGPVGGSRDRRSFRCAPSKRKNENTFINVGKKKKGGKKY